jgi:Methyltransferase domain
MKEGLRVRPHGILICHWWNEVGELFRIVDELKVGLFVEIGLLDGGLAALMLSRCDYVQGFRYIGIDLWAEVNCDHRVRHKAESTKYSFIRQRDAWAESTVNNIAEYVEMQTDAPAMIYCDGGDKTKEAHLYWPILRSGDILALHDYSDDPADVGPEVFPQDVADLLGAGQRLFREELKETRILCLRKP